MSKYLSYDDIKANVANGFELNPYMDEADKEIEDLAEILGVRNTDDIETNPVHHKVKRFGVVFAMMRLCQDKIGTNNPEMSDMEKYVVLYNMYKKEYSDIKNEISVEMITGEVNEIRDRAINTGNIFVG